MTRTVADASRDYRNKQREKIKRYEAALKEIERMTVGFVYNAPEVARTALRIEV